MKEKAIALVSGGIDSPLACLISARRFEVIPVHFCTYPMSPKKDSVYVFEIFEKLIEKTAIKEGIIFPWSAILNEIQSKVKNDYSCVVCRKSMLIAADKLGKQENAKGIVTGESLGQKASQTLENIAATSSEIGLPIIRPLLGMNKNEITKLSRKEGIWKSKHSGSCPVTPKKPRTKAKREEVERELDKIELIDKLKKSRGGMLITNNFKNPDDYLSKLSDCFRS